MILFGGVSPISDFIREVSLIPDFTRGSFLFLILLMAMLPDVITEVAAIPDFVRRLWLGLPYS